MSGHRAADSDQTATGVVVTGTDTGVGKTIFAAALTDALGGYYYKPVQAGLDGETDSETVARLAGLPPDRILPECYRLAMPASPNIAARHEGIELDIERLARLPAVSPLIVEGAGGVMVPVTDDVLFTDLFSIWARPVIVCARTTLGTINHSLLTLEALAKRGIAVHGIAFIGGANPEVETAIARIAGVPRLGRLPIVAPLTSDALRQAFAAAFDVECLADAVSASA